MRGPIASGVVPAKAVERDEHDVMRLLRSSGVRAVVNVDDRQGGVSRRFLRPGRVSGKAKTEGKYCKKRSIQRGKTHPTYPCTSLPYMRDLSRWSAAVAGRSRRCSSFQA